MKNIQGPKDAIMMRALNLLLMAAGICSLSFGIVYLEGTAYAEGTGPVVLTLQEAEGVPIAGVKTYLFNDTGQYQGVSVVTNSQGLADYGNLNDGSYTIRADYMGYQFWSPVINVPVELAVTLDIPHYEMTVTVQGECNGVAEPKPNIPMYLFHANGTTYLQKTGSTGSEGILTWHVPSEVGFKVRGNYLNQQFWSEVVTGTNPLIAIPEMDVTVSLSSPLNGIPVYVFSGAETYLNINGQTASGNVVFRLPHGCIHSGQICSLSNTGHLQQLYRTLTML